MTTETIKDLLRELYGHVPGELLSGIEALMQTTADSNPSETMSTNSLWSEQDVVLISYADQIRSDDACPLETLRSFLIENELDDQIRCVHLLPFFPYTSDDGFSVVDYLEVDQDSGNWDEIARIGESFDLMFDLVLNHCSQSHAWFRRYLNGDPDYESFFIDQDPSMDLSAVTRPRSLPLLTPFESSTGEKHIWTTFSADQVDLNYANPHVMLRMLETLVEYGRRGARIIRLDAIAYLWKIVGTSCIHLPQTHAAVRLMRAVLDQAVPGTLVLTETNVPHVENIRYFGSGDNEAHMVYQFSLPPLLLDAIHSGDTSALQQWLKTLSPPSSTTTFFNFTASHDGIGVRPLEGLVAPERVRALAEVVRNAGGRVNTRRNADGTDAPYELNITYLDAVADRRSVSPAEHSRRFLATQAIMLAMQGVPAVYFHSLVGTPNDEEGVRQSGQNRSINRHKYRRDELEGALADVDSLQRRVFDGYRRLLNVRKTLVAFHPNASQTVLELPVDGLLGFLRKSASGETVAVIANLSDQPKTIDASVIGYTAAFDVLAEETLRTLGEIALRPFQVRWIVDPNHAPRIAGRIA
ncbi:alpha-amylase family glycosyl hydrolase [Novipirellula artificiosorum]|uniref:Sucrose phosphorylase n=1 Tax=Novipirellula artificiosorum TaxID=2528016 RepID=A0A5C6DCA9_9BACT|nr:alpha-amylase family glycosyl hydrolase [Novipirellula artificiosorum]TWU33407.1 Sucrose phosphorylase [Novipirellula artificiosorum]